MQPILDSFQQIAKPGARLAVVGVYHAPATINMMMLCYSSWLIGGCGTTPLEDLCPEIIEMMQSGKFDIAKIISHEYSVEDIVEAFKMAFNPEEALKVAISYV
jgi:threonine dehydrogenase-like Zn-dependent dehydrogenase